MLSLLMIDDDPVECDRLTSYLTPEGFEVTSVHDGSDGLQEPFPSRELLARLHAVLRRTQKRFGNLKPLPVVERIVVGDVELEPGSRVARCRGELLDLTFVEFGFLELLIRAAGRIVTGEQLAEKILGRSLTAYDHSTYVHMSNLRKNLAPSSMALKESNPCEASATSMPIPRHPYGAAWQTETEIRGVWSFAAAPWVGPARPESSRPSCYTC